MLCVYGGAQKSKYKFYLRVTINTSRLNAIDPRFCTKRILLTFSMYVDMYDVYVRETNDASRLIHMMTQDQVIEGNSGYFLFDLGCARPDCQFQGGNWQSGGEIGNLGC